MVNLTNTKAFRQDIVTRIQAIPAFPAAANVFNHKVLPTQTTAMPCVGVYSPAQRGEQKGKHSPIFTREIEIVIEAIANHGSNTVDDMLTTIKNTLYSDSTWFAGFDEAPGYEETRQLNSDGDRALEIGTLTLTITTTEN